MVAIIGVLCFAVFVLAVLAIVMLGAEYDRFAADTAFEVRNPHAAIADDMHLAKVSHMAEAMKADRAAAIEKIGGRV